MYKNIIRIVLMMIIISPSSYSQDITFNDLPAQLQLFPRDQNDSSIVNIAGAVYTGGFDSISVDIFKNNTLWKRLRFALSYVDTTAAFSFSPTIHAEQSEYRFAVYLDTVLVAERDSIVCGDVYLINGQSNALAIDYDGKATYCSEWFRSFGHSGQTKTECSSDLTWGLAQGSQHSAHAAVGVWGLQLGQLLVEKYNIPICIISGATGGSYIADHLRKDSNPTDLNTNYGRLLYRTKNANVQNGVKAFLWNQGEMNTDKTYASYAADFQKLYSAWKQDFTSLEKVYLFQIRPCVADKNQSALREEQRKIAIQYADVEIMSTMGLPGHDGVHYHYEGYATMGEWISRLVARDFYMETDTLYITPPAIQQVAFTTADRNEIALIFDQPVIWPRDTLGASLKDYFYLLNDNSTTIDTGYVMDENSVILHFSQPTTATTITYMASRYYNGTTTIYEGPWLTNLRGIGALSFNVFPMTFVDVDAKKDEHYAPAIFKLYTSYPNPFQSYTTVHCRLDQPGRVKILIFNVAGQIVETIDDVMQMSQDYYAQWSPDDLPNGVYFARMYVNERLLGTKRMIYLK